MQATDDKTSLAAAVAALREEVSQLGAELDELRRYIGEIPALECGITRFEDWKREQEQEGPES